MADEQPSAGRVARDAALQSLASNAVYLLLMIGATVALTRRDWLARQALRLRRAAAGRRPEHGAAMAEVRAEISRIEHGS